MLVSLKKLCWCCRSRVSVYACLCRRKTLRPAGSGGARTGGSGRKPNPQPGEPPEELERSRRVRPL